MGERGARREPATAEDNKAMAALAADAIRAGALGFSTSRTINHRTSTGDFTPTLKAGEDELTAIAERDARRRARAACSSCSTHDRREDLPMMLRWPKTPDARSRSGGAASAQPDRWRRRWTSLAEANATGISVTAQIAARPVGLLLGLELSRHPFQTAPSYKAIAHLPLAEQVRRMRDPAVRAAILSEQPEQTSDPLFSRPNYDWISCSAIRPTTSSRAEHSLSARAVREGKSPQELAYDAMLEDDGRGMLYVPGTNYARGNLDAVRDMLTDPSAVPGLSDGGAHCGIICDASFPTYLLTHWTRDRKRGEKLSIPFVVEAQARRTAELVGLLRSRRAGPRLQGRHQRDRLRQAAPASAEGALRPADGRTPPAAADRRLRRDHRLRRGQPRQGQSTGARSGRLMQGVQAAPV